MARIEGAPANRGGPVRRLFVSLVYSRTRRRLGRVILPVQRNRYYRLLFRLFFAHIGRWVRVRGWMLGLLRALELYSLTRLCVRYQRRATAPPP